MAMATGLAALMSSAVAMMNFSSRKGLNLFVSRLQLCQLTVELSDSIYVIVSCLTDDRNEYPPRSKAY